jgi:hypothetical protein
MSRNSWTRESFKLQDIDERWKVLRQLRPLWAEVAQLSALTYADLAEELGVPWNRINNTLSHCCTPYTNAEKDQMAAVYRRHLKVDRTLWADTLEEAVGYLDSLVAQLQAATGSGETIRPPYALRTMDGKRGYVPVRDEHPLYEVIRTLHDSLKGRNAGVTHSFSFSHEWFRIIRTGKASLTPDHLRSLAEVYQRQIDVLKQPYEQQLRKLDRLEQVLDQIAAITIPNDQLYRKVQKQTPERSSTHV